MKRGLMIIVLLLFVSLAMNSSTFAEEKKTEKNKKVEIEPIKVTATTKTPVLLKHVTEAVTVVTREDIENQKAHTVLEVLRNVPGADVVKSGSMGGTTSIFLRGGESDHTLVLIDGIEVNSTTTGSFNFADLTTDNIERIEILRGQQSTLYGSEAMGGVINIVTKKGKGKPELSISSESGTHETFIERTSLAGAFDRGNYSFIFSRTDSDGQFKNDDYKNSAFSGKVGFNIMEDIDWDLTLRYTETERGIQDGGFVTSPDLNRTNDRKEFLISSLISHKIFDWWDHSLRFGVHDDEIKDTDPPDPSIHITGDTNRTIINTKVTSIDWQSNVYVPEKFGLSNIITVGLGAERKEGSNDTPVPSWGSAFSFDESFNEKSAFIQNQLIFKEMIFINAGVRVDDVSTFGTDINPKISGALMIEKTGTKIRGTFAKGFKAPSINELFYPNYGNRNLKPEQSKGYEAGIEQWLFSERVHGGATYFFNEFENLIIAADPDGDGNYLATNVNEAETEGIELFLKLNPGWGFLLKASYTHQRTEDTKAQSVSELVRRPNDRLGLNINYNFKNRLNVNLDITDVGDRLDSGNKKNPGYTKTDLAGSLILFENHPGLRLKRFEIFAKAENLLAEDYEEVLNYPAPGLVILGGCKITFF